MKRCPTCNRTYPDDTISFCLEDGVPLLSVAASDPGVSGLGANFDPNVTLKFDDPRDTNPPPTQMIDPALLPSVADLTSQPPPAPPPPPTPTIQASGLAQPEPAWQPPLATSTPPPVTPVSISTNTQEKKSMLPWLIGGGLVLAFLGIGIVGILVYAAMNGDDNSNKPPVSTDKTAKDDKTETSGDKEDDGKPSETNGDAASFKDDFSDSKWPTGAKGMNSVYQDEQYIMQHGVANQFIANYAPDGVSDYNTNGVKSVAVTVKGLDAKAPQYGHGLVLHGNVVNGTQLNGYAFVVQTAKGQVSVAHLNKSALTFLVENKAAPMVLKGAAENRLEVRLSGNKMDFYVNNQLAASVNDKGDMTGRVGFFTSTGGQVAFDDLEIVK
jgi:hypothetical protein